MFENLNEKITKTGKAVEGKTKKIAESAKLSYKVSEEKRALEQLFTALGKACYKAESENSESVYADSCAEINEKITKIEEMKAQIRAVKGLVVCDNCGAEVSIENDYCGKCGSKLNKPAPVEEPVEEPETEPLDEVDDAVSAEESEAEVEKVEEIDENKDE